MKTHLVVVEQSAVRGAIQGACAPGHHDDAVALAAAGGFHHEVPVLHEHLRQSAHLLLDFDHAVEFRHRDPGLRGKLFGKRFVIDQRVAVARVVRQDVLGVAPVDAEHAVAFEQRAGAKPVHHRASTRKR